MTLRTESLLETIYFKVESEMDKDQESTVTTLLAKIPDRKLEMALEAEINHRVATAIEHAFAFGFQCGQKPELLLFEEALEQLC